ncbi:hypothetical protein AAFO90_22905 [Phaeobacter sp. CAU 1743]
MGPAKRKASRNLRGAFLFVAAAARYRPAEGALDAAFPKKIELQNQSNN